ncbi:MAG: ribose 5-phosphate isomerase B [Clostridiales bacterium]|nr:ribose 5-phosphate isomerase B [Clostridiales bacterium]
MKLAFGCDHGGFPAKNELIEFLIEKGYEVIDCGTFSDESCDYPDYAEKVCKLVTEKECEKGILICGTGIGMSIVANKISGIRCAHVTDEFSAEMTRRHNDTNVIALGARITSTENIIKLVDIFLNTPFDGGRHAIRVEKINSFDK